MDQEAGTPPSAKGKGSFWVSRKAIALLLEHKATAMQINAYLVLAKHTDESGKFSTSGIKAIHSATGVSHQVIERTVEWLKNSGLTRPPNDIQAKLVYSPEEWSKETGETIPPAPFERARVRFVLNDFNAEAADKIWISNELIEGIGKFIQPLKRLKMCGDVAARLLLIGYRESNLEQYGGISPQAFYHEYEMSKLYCSGGFVVWHGIHKMPHAFHSAVLPALGLEGLPRIKEEKDEALTPFWEALASLDSAGFIYQMVSVMDRAAGDVEAQVIYELDAKCKHGYKPQGEKGLGGDTARLSGELGYPVADSTGRLYGRYAAVVPAGIQPHIVGIYRLRFRVSNTRNHGVAQAWARIHQGQREAAEWIESLAAQEGIYESPPKH